ncbi:hypothetical protein Tco_1037925, partial [Tanacetum coccineum]
MDWIQLLVNNWSRISDSVNRYTSNIMIKGLDPKEKELMLGFVHEGTDSPATNPGYPGRLVAGDTFPGRHVARDKWNGIARMGFLLGRHSRATSPGPHSFSQTIKCHGGSPGKVLGIIPKCKMRIPIYLRNVRGTSASEALQ